LQSLRRGVQLKDGVTQPAKARLMDEPEGLWPRNPPIRVRKSVPDSWIAMTIREGKNRQIRRMTAAIGHPCLRLIRAQIGEWHLGDLKPGEYKRLMQF
jgi:23S rRNA pseudouridine2457 synthase